MSGRFGPNFAPRSFALQQSVRLVHALRTLSRGRNRATRATRYIKDAHTERAHTHTLGNGDATQQPARDSEEEVVAAAAAPPPPPPPPLLLLLLLLPCCCCAAAASRPAMHRGAQPVTTDCFSFCVVGTYAGAAAACSLCQTIWTRGLPVRDSSSITGLVLDKSFL